MYENAQYVSDGQTIRVDINGIESFVPCASANTDYAAIMALVAEGKLTIGAAE